MWQKLYFFYFTRRSSRKSFRFFPTTSVQGTDGSRRAGSKEPGIVSPWLRLSFSSSSDSPCVTTPGFGCWSRHLPTLSARQTPSSRKRAEPISSPDPSQGTLSLGLQFCLSKGRNRHEMACWWWSRIWLNHDQKQGRALEFSFGGGILLGECSGIFVRLPQRRT